MILAVSKKRKETLLEEYKKTLQSNSAIVFTDYAGLSVKQLENLRKKLRETGGEFFIVKNSIVKRAFVEIGLSEPEGGIVGPTAIGVASEEIPAMVKTIVELTKEAEVFEVTGAIIDGVPVGAAQIRRLADLPPMPVLQAQFLALLNTPATQMAGILTGSMRQLLNVLKAYSETGTEAAAAA